MSIAIVGMACRYPDARTPAELWENVLAQRRAFRRMPRERMRLEDYWSPVRGARDRTYAAEAALITDWEFDRVAYRVAGSTFRSADLAHWLALDIAALALEDAGFGGGNGLPRETTGVLLGNTLTGEFSRANAMRLRWPYVRRVLEAELDELTLEPARRRALIERLEERYKAPFPEVGEETLAGGLSNTIAGRICNHFDLGGGGFTVDGACASSLLAISQSCSALVARDLDVAIAGGVDLSLDPFELVGFAMTSALAPVEMRVYDRRSAGFWPGEGCGVLVLMREEDALAQGRRVIAAIRGWGISSDGSGGLTRPEVGGQLLAIRRAYRRAGFGIETVGYFEGHGTGTSVGDATELAALSRARREASASSPAALGSIKANLGHTKAAAGAAGIIKAALVLHHQVLPPTTGCDEPHVELTGESPALRVLREAEAWPEAAPRRAGVSSMGFGGINTHLALEAADGERRQTLTPHERSLAASAQDAELFLLGAADAAALGRDVDRLAALAPSLARAELGDLAAWLGRSLAPSALRAGIVAATPAELARRLETLRAWLREGVRERLAEADGVFLGARAGAPRIGFLFPGQGSPARPDGGRLRLRFPSVRALYAKFPLPAGANAVATEIAQPAIVTASLAALRLLDALGIEAEVAVGHSLGELTALHWGGVVDEEALLALARARGGAMRDLGSPTGAMASIRAGRDEVTSLLGGAPVTIAGLNAPRQTVISGEALAVETVVARARALGLTATRLSVSHAFHSPLVGRAAPALDAELARVRLAPLTRAVHSTVTGARLERRADTRALLVRQVTAPVRFHEAVASAADGLDLWIEAGPGTVLSGLAGEIGKVPALSLDAGSWSIAPLLAVVGAAHALGAPLRHAALFDGRFARPIDPERRPRFFVNPCELAPARDAPPAPTRGRGIARDAEELASVPAHSRPVRAESEEIDTLALVRELVAARAELPADAVRDESRLLVDLHLNSITVGQLVADALRRLELAPSRDLTSYAGATVAELALALEELKRVGPASSAPRRDLAPSGIDTWVRAFTLDHVERPPRPSDGVRPPGAWTVFAEPGDALGPALDEALRSAGGSGVAVCLPASPGERHLPLLLEAARRALAQHPAGRFALVQRGPDSASFARSLHLEAPWIATSIVEVPEGDARAASWAAHEAVSGPDFSDCRYDADGRRWEPVLSLLPPDAARHEAPLGPDDVLLVTGGGKGIAAECALALARESGARLALIGRSHPEADAELSRNLERMAAAGVRARYEMADVTDAEAVAAAVRAIEAALGGITALLHGAGINRPRLVGSLDVDAFRETLAPKVEGARNVLAALDPSRLRMLVAFGSIIARTGMRGEADYALANEWLARLVGAWRDSHPHCRALVVEWSVWSGVGMGERLGRIDALAGEGVTAITPDQGIAMLRELLERPLPATAIVVSGRFGSPPTLRMRDGELPLLRFLERPLVHVPGVELIVEAELSADTDPYLEDHVFQGERLLPAVMGLEAMAQAAMALANQDSPPRFEDVRFERPVVVAAGESTSVRLLALARGPGRIDVALRCSTSGFQADHFRAACIFGAPAEREAGAETAAAPDARGASPALDPARELYGEILFQRGRFRRLRAYAELRATSCIADISPDGATAWFGRYLPAELVLGDPAARDAAMHAVQACIPHAVVLPVSVERIVPFALSATEGVRVRARQRAETAQTLVYDLDLIGSGGAVLERWEGLTLRRVAPQARSAAWPEMLLAPYVERRVSELLPGARVGVVMERGREDARESRGACAASRLLGREARVRHRPDGRPEVDGTAISLAHAGELTLAVGGDAPVGCDLEAVRERAPEIWRDLLAPERYILAQSLARETGEGLSSAATRVWSAGEALRKAGVPAGAPLTLVAPEPDGWVVLASGRLAVVTLISATRGSPGPMALAVLCAAPS
jgi:enediyne polyketide synthase